MKVLWFHSGVGAAGGGYTAMLYALKSLRSHSVESTIVCTEDPTVVQALRDNSFPAQLERRIRRLSSTVMTDPIWSPRGALETIALGPTLIRSIRAARETIGAVRPEVVHLNMAPLAPVAIAASQLGVPVVWHIRESLNLRGAPVRGRFNREIIRRYATRIVAINHETLRQLQPVAEAEVIYDGVPLDEFSPEFDGEAFRRSLGYSRDKILIGVLNGVSWIKGTLVYARAARIALSANPQVRFINVGEYDTPAKSWAQQLKRRLGRRVGYPRYAERVMREIEAERNQGLFNFIEPVSDVRGPLAALDILAFPAMTSHSPLPAIEAAAMMKPVVASDWPAIREVVSEGVTGLLFPPGDAEALAQAILGLAEDRDLRNTLGENAHITALERFDSRKNTARLQEIYQKVTH